MTTAILPAPRRGEDPAEPVKLAVWHVVQQVQNGDTHAFGQLYDRYVDTVFRFIYFRVGNRQLAEDLTSDTFVRALKRIGSYVYMDRDFGAWLVTIARNLVADHFKSGRYRLEVTTGDVLNADKPEVAERGPEAATINYLSNVELLTAMQKLTADQFLCLKYRFLDGLNVAETAHALGCTEGATKALQHRAVRTLARLLPEGFKP